MAVFTVTTALDAVNGGDGVLSLREAVSQANATAAADTILFAGALEGRTLTLTQGQLDLTGDLAIDGDRNDDGTEVTISGGDASRVLAISGSATDVGLNDLTIADGNTIGAPLGNAGGAGILADAGVGLALSGCTLQGNDAYDGAGSGGALFAAAGSEVAIERSLIRGNRAYDGGGIFFAGAHLTIDQTLIGENRAFDASSSGNDGTGGGVAVAAGVATITGSTIAANASGLLGGGLWVGDGTVSLVNSTVAGNAAGSIYGFGGGIYATGDLALANVTVTGNYADNPNFDSGVTVGGGVLSTGALSIGNSILAGNFSGSIPERVRDDVEGDITASNGHNLFGRPVAGEAAGDRENVAVASLFAALDPETGGGRLAPNGGATPTVALRDAAGNPAHSGGEPVLAGGVDQRGVDRPGPAGTNPDIGAFELAQGVVSRSPTAGNDVLTGTAAADRLNGLAGADLLIGLGGGDRLSGGAGGDTLRGGVGNDALDGQGGQDTASYRDATAAVGASLAAGTASGAHGADTLTGIENLEGGSGRDRLTGDGLANALGGRTGADRLFGLAGDDRLVGGAGDDLLEGGRGSDRIDGGPGVDLASWFNDAGPSGLELDLATGVATRAGERDLLAGVEGADGTNNADVLRGDGRANALGGAGGADQLFGRFGDDALLGALGDDRLNGALGRDTQTGGAGRDVFDFDRLADSVVGAGRDLIADFTHLSDRIDLATIDARAATAANDAFTFRSGEGTAFTGAGQVRWFHAGGATIVEASVDADRAPELQVELAGLKILSAGDFVL